ncbi:hypothetical protein [Frondihabitans sucicola]|nr:hypothetical protein [Frondihabitans sucicola]
MADPDSAPSRPVFANARAAADVERILGEYQLQHPEDPIHFTIDNYIAVSEEDQAIANQWVRFTIYSKDIDTLPSRLAFPEDLDASSTPVISSLYALSTARAHMDANGGFIKKGEQNATADAVVTKFRLPKDERQAYLLDTKENFITGFESREYLQSMTPTTDFERRVQAVAKKEFVEERELPLLAAGANMYAQEQERRRRDEARASRPPAAPKERRVGEWLGSEGGDVHLVGKIISNRVVELDGGETTRYMHVALTEQGDRIRVFSDNFYVREGDVISIEGYVEEHVWFAGKKQTNVTDAYVKKADSQVGRFQ